MSTDHNAVITAQARHVLKPLGLVRKGKSRVWIDDHGWWTIQVQFQPSSWSKGSYLNVGINWLLYEGNVGTFHIGSRVDVPFIEATESETYERDAHGLALRAKDEVEKLRTQFSTVDDVASYYRISGRSRAWDDYYFAVVLAITGDIVGARAAFESVLTRRMQYGWEKALAQRATELHKLASNRTDFMESIRGIVLRTRLIGNMPEWESDFVFP